jgi:TonB family protein
VEVAVRGLLEGRDASKLSMAAYPDLRSEPVSVDHFIRKIVLLCDRHDVAWGTPEKLAEFIRALKDNKHLAMDFWSVVAQMSAETSVVGPEPHRLLEVIVEGVTGRTVAEVIGVGSAQRQAINDLASLLAGEDIWNPVGKSSKREETRWVEDSTKRPAVTAKSNGRANGLAKDAARETSGATSIRREARDSVSEAVDRDVPVSAPISTPRTESSGRSASLPTPPVIYSSESHSNAMRYSSVAPPGTQAPLSGAGSGGGDDTHRRILLEPEPFSAEPKAVRHEGEPFHVAPEALLAHREPLRRERWHSEAELAEEHPYLVCVDDPLIRIPLAQYEETSKSHKGLVTGVVLLAIVGVGAFAALVVRGGGGDLGRRFRLGIEGVRASIAQNAIVQSVHDRVMGSGQGASVKTSSLASGEADGAGATTGSQERAASQPPAVGTSSGAAAASGSNAGASDAGAAGRDSSNRVVSPQVEQEKRATRQIAEPAEVESGGAVQVPADVMTSHLISSRVPVYPEEAKAHHAEGPVVMQAVITKSGAVGHLHVLSGDPALRAAAVAAVATWLYRPYTQNGVPVDVLTTISVEFPADW